MRRSMMPRPSRLLAPLRYAPRVPLELLIGEVTSRVLAEPLADGALSGLGGGAIRVEVVNPDVHLRFTVAAGRVIPAAAGNETRVVIRAELEDLLLVMAQRIDPDTLFFQRRLQVQGDTSLGLEVKNLLDTVDIARLPRPLQAVLASAAGTVDGVAVTGVRAGEPM